MVIEEAYHRDREVWSGIARTNHSSLAMGIFGAIGSFISEVNQCGDGNGPETHHLVAGSRDETMCSEAQISSRPQLPRGKRSLWLCAGDVWRKSSAYCIMAGSTLTLQGYRPSKARLEPQVQQLHQVLEQWFGKCRDMASLWLGDPWKLPWKDLRPGALWEATVG